MLANSAICTVPNCFSLAYIEFKTENALNSLEKGKIMTIPHS